MLIVPCSQGLTNINSVCLHEIRGFNKWKIYINTLTKPFGELVTEPGFKTSGIQTLSLFLQVAAAKQSHLRPISVAQVVKALLITPQTSNKPGIQKA